MPLFTSSQRLKSHKISMAFPSLPATFLALLFSFSPLSLSQQQSQAPATMASCGALLLPLVPCAPFVQAIATSPTQPCCNNLSQLYTQQPDCLCLLLNNTSALSLFPINTTLASELPILCSLQAGNTTICSGAAVHANPPASPIPSGSHPNSTIAASPEVTATPKTSILGYSRNEGTMLKIHIQLIVLFTVYLYM